MIRGSLIIPFLFGLTGLFAQGNVRQMLDKASLIYDENPAESYALCESAERSAIASGDNSLDGNISLCKARYLILIASFESASIELNKAILFFEKEQDTFNITYALNLKALMLGKMGDVYEAHKMQLRSIDLIRKSGADRRLINPLLNIILNYIDFDQPDSVRSCLAELETKVDLFDPEDYYYYYQNWGSYFVMIGDYKRGIQQYQLALEVAETQKMTDARATCLMLLARAFRLYGSLDKADQCAEESYTFSQENNLIYESSEALQEWILVKKDKGQFRQAFEIQEKWVKVNKQIYDIEKIQRVKAIEGQLEIAQKEKQIAQGELQLKEAKLEGQRAKTRNAWLIGIVAAGFILLTFTVFIYIRTKKLNTTINEQKHEVELKSLRLEDALENIEASLHYSKMIQSSMLPARNEFQEVFKEHFILYKPKDIVSGDFYWMHKFESYVVLAVADCTGHGVPGAMVSMVCNEALNKIIIEQQVKNPAEALNSVRDIIAATFKRNENEISDGMDISLVVFEKDHITYAGANNSLWIFRNKAVDDVNGNQRTVVSEFENCNLIELKADKQPVGFYFAPKPFLSVELKLEKGDKVYLFSDGYADQFGGDKGKKLKASNLKTLIANAYPLDMVDQGKHLDNVFVEWKGDLEQIDDVCIVGVRV